MAIINVVKGKTRTISLLFLLLFTGLLMSCGKGEAPANDSKGNKQSEIVGSGDSAGLTADLHSTKTFKIGVLEPLSGKYGSRGLLEGLGIRYANKVCPTLNVGGEIYNIELIELDNQSDPKEAASMAEKLISENVSVVIGSYGSELSFSAGELLKDAGIPLIIPSCTDTRLTTKNPLSFRIGFQDPFEASVTAYYAIQNSYKNAAVFWESELNQDNTDTHTDTQDNENNEKNNNNENEIIEIEMNRSKSLSSCFVEAFKMLGGNIVWQGTADPGKAHLNTNEAGYGDKGINGGSNEYSANGEVDKDGEGSDKPYIETLIEEFKSLNVDVIYIPLSVPSATELIQKIKAGGIDALIIGREDWEDIQAINKAKGALEGAVICSSFAESHAEGEKAGAFLSGFSEYLKDNKQPSFVHSVSALGYDSYFVVVDAIEAASSIEKEDIISSLNKLEMDGVTGHISFDRERNRHKERGYLMKINDGVFQFIKKIEIE